MSTATIDIQYHQIENGSTNTTQSSLPLAQEVIAREERILAKALLQMQPKPMANPGPLGLCGFALTTFVLSLYNAGGLVCK